MLQPKRSKHRKQQKGRIREVAKRGTSIAFGSFALKSLDPIWLTSRQIESARQAMTRAVVSFLKSTVLLQKLQKKQWD